MSTMSRIVCPQWTFKITIYYKYWPQANLMLSRLYLMDKCKVCLHAEIFVPRLSLHAKSKSLWICTLSSSPSTAKIFLALRCGCLCFSISHFRSQSSQTTHYLSAICGPLCVVLRSTKPYCSSYSPPPYFLSEVYFPSITRCHSSHRDLFTIECLTCHSGHWCPINENAARDSLPLRDYGERQEPSLLFLGCSSPRKTAIVTTCLP